MAIRRVTLPLLYVVRAVLDDPASDHYAYSISKATGLLTGTVQPIMARLEAEGWLTSRREDIDVHVEGRRPRRLYRLTAEGRRAGQQLLDERVAAPAPFFTAAPLPGLG